MVSRHGEAVAAIDREQPLLLRLQRHSGTGSAGSAGDGGNLNGESGAFSLCFGVQCRGR